jgi:hypothetical protein
MPCLTNLPPVHVQKLGTHPRTLAIRLDSEPNDHYTSSCCEQCRLLTQLDIGRQWLAEIAQLVEHATENRGVRSSILRLGTMRKWLSGRASPCQGEGRRFDPGLPLQWIRPRIRGLFVCLVTDLVTNGPKGALWWPGLRKFSTGGLHERKVGLGSLRFRSCRTAPSCCISPRSSALVQLSTTMSAVATAM